MRANAIHESSFVAISRKIDALLMHIKDVIYAVSRYSLMPKAPLKDYMQDRRFTSKTRCALFFACEKGLLPQANLSIRKVPCSFVSLMRGTPFALLMAQHWCLLSFSLSFYLFLLSDNTNLPQVQGNSYRLPRNGGSL